MPPCARRARPTSTGTGGPASATPSRSSPGALAGRDDLLLGELLARWYEGDRYVPPLVLLPTAPAEPGILQEWLQGKRGGKE